jgi:DNA-directed RNA polymerase subunit RPC12/RpoP
MATKEWKCMECGWKGKPKALVVDSDDSHACPKCKSYDVFPQRYFKCRDCGFEGEQYEFFGPDVVADQDPSEEPGAKMPACHDGENGLCDSK